MLRQKLLGHFELESMTNTFIVRDSMGVEYEWLWVAGDVEVEEPDHACGPDCICHQHVKQLRGEVTELKRSA